MSFPRYPEYKDSGLEWLGEVPGHWEVRKLPQLFRAGKGKNGQMLTKEYCAVNDGDYPVYSGQTENDGVMGTWDQFEFDFGTDGVLFSTTVGAKAMNLMQLFGRFSLSQNCMIIWTTSDGCVTRFYYYHFQPLFQWQRSMIPDHMQPSFRMEDLYSFSLAVPPPKEQTAIAAFLDRETAKIDALVTEQRRLMALLKEKRQAVISHAVTRGLNPDAPLKPSGIEWLGDVPTHWDVVPLRWAAKCCSGDGLSSTEVESVEDEIHIIRVIGGNGLMGYTDQQNVNHSLLAVGRVGALCGNVHLVHPPAWITDNALVLDPDSSIFDLQFLSMTLRSRNLNDIASKTAQPLITGTQVSDQRIPCPPLFEQEAIAAYLDEQAGRFDTLTTEAQRAIDLLQERRTALISAAVTGQIDVRGLNPEHL